MAGRRPRGSAGAGSFLGAGPAGGPPRRGGRVCFQGAAIAGSGRRALPSPRLSAAAGELQQDRPNTYILHPDSISTLRKPSEIEVYVRRSFLVFFLMMKIRNKQF